MYVAVLLCRRGVRLCGAGPSSPGLRRGLCSSDAATPAVLPALSLRDGGLCTPAQPGPPGGTSTPPRPPHDPHEHALASVSAQLTALTEAARASPWLCVCVCVQRPLKLLVKNRLHYHRDRYISNAFCLFLFVRFFALTCKQMM